MQILKQYVDLIQQFKAKKEELSIVIGDDKTLIYQFFDGIAQGKYRNDEDAAKDLYNEKPNFPAYKTLKSEFKKRLASAVVILDFKQPILNEFQQAYYICHKNWATISILVGRQKMKAAIDLAQTTLELAKKFEITEVMVNASRLLTRTYHLHRPLSNLADEYEKTHREAHALLQAEYLAETLYDDLSKHFIKIKATQRHLQAKALDYLAQLKPFCERFDSHRLHLSTRMIEVTSCMCVNDYESALKVSEEAIVFFENKPFEYKNAIAVFLHQKTVCCMQLRKFEEGRDSATRSRNLVLEGTHNWYKDGLTFIQLCFHNQEYTEGWKIFLEMLTHAEYVNQTPIVKEEMSIVETYMQYLIKTGKIKLQRGEHKFAKAFDYYAFIGSQPTFQKDKRGMNIPALIAQILWLLHEKSYDSIRFRAEALDKYRTRHVDKNEDTYRTNMIIRLINQLEKGQYRRKKIERKTVRTLADLKSAPVQVKNQAYATEILPYEDTWQLMMDCLV